MGRSSTHTVTRTVTHALEGVSSCGVACLASQALTSLHTRLHTRTPSHSSLSGGRFLLEGASYRRFPHRRFYTLTGRSAEALPRARS